ncbi:PLP-dependent aminotransferase family protein [Rhizohabitans arisaemae]|uniref:MocR-like transcription factor YczR n=1 Tax=Rhizohabitans arisaemae TaxID=2720610 RepID=UPI0024B0EC73|nr:PLP-dependent aminotransferase family protein [Rhizohabitans arisaemae]
MNGGQRSISAAQLARLTSINAEARPYYRALADAVRALIMDGRLPLHVRLPAERHLAEALGVSRTTVTAAYDRLREGGHIESRQGSGSWTALPAVVAPGAGPWAVPADDSLIQLQAAAPPAPAILRTAMAEAFADHAEYEPGIGLEPLGVPALREAVASRYTERGLATRPDQIIVTSGAQQAVTLLMNLLAGPGDPVLVESPTYPHVFDMIRHRGARIVPVGVGDDGWSLDLLGSAIRQAAVRLAYLIPDFHNPTGLLMDDADRAALVALARRHDTTLLVDESWVECGIDAGATATPLACFDHDGRVISIGSAAKLWWGGMRIGWIRATAAMIRRIADHRAVVDIASPLFEQLVVARLFARMAESKAERIPALRASRDTLTEALRTELPGWSFRTPSGGGFLWVRLDGPVATQVAEEAALRGVRLTPGHWFGVEGTLERYLRLPFTQPPAVLADAVRRIASAHAMGPFTPPRSLSPTV